MESMEATTSTPTKTLVITHDHCAKHIYSKRQATTSERPDRIEWVMNALHGLRRDITTTGGGDIDPLDVREVKTSEPMLQALQEQLVSLASAPRTAPSPLARSFSVGYLEEKIIPSVRAVHTQEYIEKLAKKCWQASSEDNTKNKTMDTTKKAMDKQEETQVSASSLSAALCAALSSCCALATAAHCPMRRTRSWTPLSF